MKIFDKVIANINKIILIFTIIVLAISFYLLYSLNHTYTQKETIHSLENALLLTRNLIDEEQQHALSLSLLLSEDKSFLDAFYQQNREKTFDIINAKLSSLKKLQGYTFEVQVHDQDLHTYLRSWDFSIKDVPLASFRQGLVLVKEHKKPLASIEVGKRLNIKAISPILKDGKFQGSIEVISEFEHLRKKLSEQGYALFIILDKKYLSIATTLKKYSLLDNQFVLIDAGYATRSSQSLKKTDFDKLGDYGYFSQDGYAFGYFEIKNFYNDRLGYCLVAIQQDIQESMQENFQSDTIDKNISGVIIR